MIQAMAVTAAPPVTVLVVGAARALSPVGATVITGGAISFRPLQQTVPPHRPIAAVEPTSGALD